MQVNFINIYCLEQCAFVILFEVLSSLYMLFFEGSRLSLIINRPNGLPEVLQINPSLFVEI